MLTVIRRGLVSSDFSKTRKAGREWTESFEVVIVRKPRRTALEWLEQWKNEVVL